MSVSESAEDQERLNEVMKNGDTRLIIRSILLRVFEESNYQHIEDPNKSSGSGWKKGRRRKKGDSDEFKWIRFLNVLSKMNQELIPLLLEELVSWLETNEIRENDKAVSLLPSGWVAAFQMFMDLYLETHS